MKEVGSLKTERVNTKRIVKKNRYIKEPLLAAFITLLSYLFISVLSEKMISGNYSFLIGDLEAQYAPFLFLYKSHLKSLSFENFASNFTYSFSLGAGNNFMGTLGYYLSSPLNFLVFLFDESHVNEFIMLLVAIKLMLSSGFMCLFLHYRNSEEYKNSKWTIPFGVIYSFSSYIAYFMLNIQWLDGYYLLPLLLLTIELMIEKKKVIGFMATLFFLFLSNYYIAYIVGVFSFFYFLVRLYQKGDYSFKKGSIKLIIRFILCAISVALLLSVIILPCGINTLSSRIEVISSTPRKPDYLTFRMIDLVDMVFLGRDSEFDSTLIDNPPFVFLSLLVTILNIVYYFSECFSKREKRLNLGITIAIFVSIMIYATDIMWQAFDEPNWFCHRQTFVFMPFFLLIAMRTLQKIKEISYKAIGKSSLVILVMLCFTQVYGYMAKSEKNFLFNLIMIGAYYGILLLFKIDEWPKQLINMPKIVPALVSLLVIYEVVILAYTCSSGVATMGLSHGEKDEYVLGQEAYKELTDIGNGINENAFRSALELQLTLEKYPSYQSFYYEGARDISLFNTNSNKNFTSFMSALGFYTNYNFFLMNYSQQALDTSAFLSIDSVKTRNIYSDADLTATDSFGTDLKLYKLPSVFALAFEANESALDFSYEDYFVGQENIDLFNFRNDWYESMFNDEFDRDFFIPVEESNIDFEVLNGMIYDLEGIYSEEIIPYISSEEQVSSEEENDTSDMLNEDGGLLSKTYLNMKNRFPDAMIKEYYRMNRGLPIILSHDIHITSDDELYYSISTDSLLSGVSLYVNGKALVIDNQQYSEISRIGSFEIGEVVNISVVTDVEKLSFNNISFAYFDSDSFVEMFERIDKTGVEVIDAQNGVVDLKTNIDSGNIIITSIPYDNGWTASLDGNDLEIIPYQNATIALRVPTGEHDVRLTFVAPGLKVGALFSILGLVMCIALILIKEKQPMNK